jgi:hypothetical protein
VKFFNDSLHLRRVPVRGSAIGSLNLPLIIINGIVGRERGITCTQEINTSATEATAVVGIVGDGPTVVAGDDVAVLLEECKPGSTLVEHPQNYL